MIPWLLAIALAGAAPHPPTATDDGRQAPPISWEGTLSSPPVPHWTAEAPGGRVSSARHTERGQPVLSGDTLFLGTAAGEALYAIDRRNGVVRTTYPAAGSVQAAPAVTGEAVFFGDTGGRLWRYRRDGRPGWSYAAGAPILVQPLIVGDTVYVATVEDLVLALDAATGELRWRYQHKTDIARRAELSLYAAPPPVMVGEQLFVGFSDGTLMSIEPQGGDPRWQRRIGSGRYPDVVAAPLSADDLGLVYVSGYYEPFAALDPAEGKVVWTAPNGAAARPALAVVEGRTLLIQPGTDGRLRAFDAKTGDPIWTWDSGSSGALTAPVLTAAGVLVASTDQTVELVGLEDGETLWSYVPDMGLDGVSVSPVVDGRQVVFLTNAGRLVSLRSPRPPRPSPRDDGMRVDLGVGAGPVR